MTQERNSEPETSERTVLKFCRANRREYCAEEKLRITRQRLPGEEPAIYPAISGAEIIGLPIQDRASRVIRVAAPANVTGSCPE